MSSFSPKAKIPIMEANKSTSVSHKESKSHSHIHLRSQVFGVRTFHGANLRVIFIGNFGKHFLAGCFIDT